MLRRIEVHRCRRADIDHFFLCDEAEDNRSVLVQCKATVCTTREAIVASP